LEKKKNPRNRKGQALTRKEDYKGLPLVVREGPLKKRPKNPPEHRGRGVGIPILGEGGATVKKIILK